VQEQPPIEEPTATTTEETKKDKEVPPPPVKPRRRPLDNAGMEELARTNPIAFLEESLKRYDREVRGYRVTLLKQEFLEGRLQPVERIEASFREKPFSVLMEWKEGMRLARKTLYVQGQNKGKLLALPACKVIGWLAGIQSRDPDSAAARKSSRYPITEFGIKAGSENALGWWKKAQKRGELKVVFGGEKRLAELNDRPCWEVKRIDYTKPEVDGIIEATYYFDKENWLQIGSILKGENDRLIATYYFRDLVLNPEFAEDTFTRASLK
jgi:hypothetical protein